LISIKKRDFIISIFKNIDLFKDIDEITLKKIKNISVIENYEKDSIIFYEGDKSIYLHILIKGTIKLYKHTLNNKELVLKYFHRGKIIAELANYSNIPFPATAMAFNEVKILKINFDNIKKIIYSNPDISYKIHLSLIDKIKNLENIISNNLVLNCKEKIIKYIYENSNNFFTTKNTTIANILNTTPETISRVLKELKDKGIIDIQKKYINKELLKNH
jgi:CRP/FNR family transcriptional regulator